MKKVTIHQAIIQKAELELRRILKTQKVRSGQIVGELLERELFENVRLLGDFTSDEREMVQKYMRAYVWLGQPEKALDLSKKTGMSINWGDETDVVQRGYRTIARSSILSLRGATEINREGIRLLEKMKELTGIGIPEDVHIGFSRALMQSMEGISYSRPFPTLRAYINATGVVPTQESLDRIYVETTRAVTPTEAMRRASKIFSLTGIKPLEARDQLLHKYLGLETFPLIDACLPLFVDIGNPIEIEQFINSDMPPYIRAIVKISTCRSLSPEEVKDAYQLILKKCEWNYDGNILTNISNNLKYLLQHGIYPPKDISGEFYRTLDNMKRVLPSEIIEYLKNKKAYWP